MTTNRLQAIQETDYGVYVWLDTEGKIIADEDYNQLSVPAKKGDPKAIMALRDYAFNVLRDNGLPVGGRPHFLPGRRQISDSEYEEQMMRQQAGLVPDKYDIGALKEEARYAKKHG